jgi:hypothetical protein
MLILIDVIFYFYHYNFAILVMSYEVILIWWILLQR